MHSKLNILDAEKLGSNLASLSPIFLYIMLENDACDPRITMSFTFDAFKMSTWGFVVN